MKKILLTLMALSFSSIGFAAQTINFNKVSDPAVISTQRDLKPRWHQPDFTYGSGYEVIEKGAPEEAIVYVDYDAASGCDQVFFRNLKEPNADAIPITHTCDKNGYDKVAPSWGPKLARIMVPSGSSTGPSLVPCDTPNAIQFSGSLCFVESQTPDVEVENSWTVFYAFRHNPASNDPKRTYEECDEGMGCSIGMVLLSASLKAQDIKTFQTNFKSSYNQHPEFQITYPNVAAGEYDRDVTFNFNLRRVSQSFNSLAFTRYNNQFKDSANNPYALDMINTLMFVEYNGRIILGEGLLTFLTGNKTHRLSGQCPSQALSQLRASSKQPSWDSWGMNLVFSTRNTLDPQATYQIATVNIFETPLANPFIFPGMQGTPFNACAAHSYNSALYFNKDPHTLPSTSSLEVWTNDNTVDHEYPSFSPYGFAELQDRVNPGMGLQPGILYQRTNKNDAENLYELAGFRVSTGVGKFFFNYVYAYNKNQSGYKGYPASEVIFDNATYAAPHNVDVDPSYGNSIRRHPVWASPFYKIKKQPVMGLDSQGNPVAVGHKKILESVENKGWIAYERLNEFGYWEVFGEQIDLPGMKFALEELGIDPALIAAHSVKARRWQDQLNQAFMGSSSTTPAPFSGDLTIINHAFKYGVFTIYDTAGHRRQYEVVIPDSQLGTTAQLARQLINNPNFTSNIADVNFRGSAYPDAAKIYSKDPLGSEEGLIALSVKKADGTTVEFLATAYTNLHREYQWTASCSDHSVWPEFNNARMNSNYDPTQTGSTLTDVANFFATAQRPLNTVSPWPQDLAAGQIVSATSVFDRTDPDKIMAGADHKMVVIGDVSGFTIDEANTKKAYQSCEAPVLTNPVFDYSCDSKMALYFREQTADTEFVLGTIDSSGTFTDRLTYEGNFSRALAVDKDGVIYSMLNDGRATYRIVVLKRNGTYTDVGDSTIPVSSGGVNGMTVGFNPITHEQNIYALDTQSDKLYRFVPDAQARTFTIDSMDLGVDVTIGDIIVYGRYLVYFGYNEIYTMDLTLPAPVFTKLNKVPNIGAEMLIQSANGDVYAISDGGGMVMADFSAQTLSPWADVSTNDSMFDGASCPLYKRVVPGSDPDPVPDPDESCSPVRRSVGDYASLTDDRDSDGVPNACDTCPKDEDYSTKFPFHDDFGNGYCVEDIPTECLCCCTDCGGTTVNEGDTIINEGDIIINIDLPDWWNNFDNITPPIESIGGAGIAKPEQPAQGEIIPGILDESGCTEANGIWEPTISDILNQGDENLDKNEVELAVNEQAGVCRGASLSFAGAGCACDISKTAGSQNQLPLIFLALVLVLAPQFYLRKRRD